MSLIGSVSIQDSKKKGKEFKPAWNMDFHDRRKQRLHPQKRSEHALHLFIFSFLRALLNTFFYEDWRSDEYNWGTNKHPLSVV